MRKLLIVALVACGACRSKDADRAPAGSAAPVDKPAVTQPAKPARKPPTKDQLAEFKNRMKQGWALQKDKKWGEAVAQFESALEILPGDQRALAELGWSAMNAGDFT